jgi:2-polyprenyl-3-methyl-5-hydroxy-6-metoxy-1,4-benzoquinol methylase
MASSLTAPKQSSTAVPDPDFDHSRVIRTDAQPACPVCRQTGKSLYTDLVDWLYGVPGKWSTRFCFSCKLAWLDPQPAAEEVSVLYSNYCTHKANPAMPWVGRLQQQACDNVLARLGYPVSPGKALLPRILSHLPYAKRIAALSVLDLPASARGHLLDVGCGNGEFIARMRSLGWTVSGIDFDAAAVAYARSQGLDVRVARIADLDDTSVYDVIVLTHVIEHVADPIRFLRDCGQRLRPGSGRLVISTPNINSLGHALFNKYWRGLEVPRHFVLFSTAALLACVQRAGLTVRSISTETRLAQMIYNHSACAKAGEFAIADRAQFNTSTKIAARLFRMFEGLLLTIKKDLGEEIFCICTKSTAGKSLQPSGDNDRGDHA